ncbi:sigma-G-dependent sporulation-specific acid-soluble spore protein CsgA [Bacillus massilinigeriensis]|uniref:sigma-G-dependent sporulation-specific acid-soluble spore protein CsgA n=1 Tax=Bacillus massilionigeriensis TaxID=1805475 RepID=UPI00096B4A6C|nr:sigma-G-dependent sporulation-specific acid-soluble spore protein CsgA [Bacillus massilionigeriensis]
MDHTLAYLREILSNYTDRNSLSQHIYKKIQKHSYQSEGEFVRDLSEEEVDFLNRILPEEINHAKEANDDKRAYQLNEVYELLL